MQLLQADKSIGTNNPCREYTMRISRHQDLMQNPSFLSSTTQQMRQAGDYTQFALQTNDLYNQCADHIFIYDAYDRALIASTRVIAMKRVEHLRAIGGFVCQGMFDISSLIELDHHLIEVSNTFIEEGYDRDAALLQLWHGISKLIHQYQANHVIGTLMFPISEMGKNRLDVPSALLLDPQKERVWARNPCMIETNMVEPMMIHPHVMSMYEKLINMNGKIGHEAHVEDEQIFFLVSANVSHLRASAF